VALARLAPAVAAAGPGKPRSIVQLSRGVPPRLEQPGAVQGGYWDNWDAYYRNSPVFFAKNVKTPLMILHNDRDGAVDFTQGVEYYNTLRRLQKRDHAGVRGGEPRTGKRSNQRDCTVRMKEYFDHYLKGTPAPDWMKEGVPRLKMEEHLKERAKPKTPPKKITTTASDRGK